jgi:hypothetical protein
MILRDQRGAVDRVPHLSADGALSGPQSHFGAVGANGFFNATSYVAFRTQPGSLFAIVLVSFRSELMCVRFRKEEIID